MKKHPRQLNFFLIWFYRTLKQVVLFCFWIFYRKTVVVNEERLTVTKPTIVVSNHPSTLTDPLNVAGRIKTIVFFLANASLFQHWFGNWFFNTFYCIPIERPKDVGDRKISNEDSFAKCDAFLSIGGCLYIAPEGVSNLGRRLQEIKTGTARIALSAEAKNDFRLDLELLPVGLTYSAPMDFRSDVLVNAGRPIEVDTYQSIYAEDPVACVRKLTADLEARMRELIIDTSDDEEDRLLKELEKMIQAAKPLSFEEQVFRAKKMIRNLQDLRQTDAEAYEDLKRKVDSLKQTLEEKKIDQAALYSADEQPSIWFLLLGLPFFLYGWFNNFLANYFPGLLARTLPLYVGYRSTVKLLTGLITYPLFYGLQLWLVQTFFEQWWITGVYFLSLYPLGLFAWSYRKRWKDWRKSRLLHSWQKLEPKRVEELRETQKEIMLLFFQYKFLSS